MNQSRMKEAALESTVLIVDDEEDILLTLKMLLKSKVSHLYTESNPYHLPRLLRQYEPDLVLLDLNFNKGAIKGEEGLHWLGKIKEIRPQTQVIVITAHGDIEIAVRALKVGAVDFLEKPWRNEKLLSAVQSALNLSLSKREIKQLQQTRLALNEQLLQQSGDILGESPAMQDVFRTIEKVAATEANVLILGENGTGKEMVARAIHRASSRHKEVFINVDLGSIPESLLESELFGHVKGAFTGAISSKRGLVEEADGGTLFLDEIAEMSPTLQVKLLRFIQNGEIRRVGDNELRRVSVRIIAATNKDLHKMMASGEFREDLFYRVAVIPLHLPPLRDRDDDISLLAQHFLRTFAEKSGKSDLHFSQAALHTLTSYRWPGNVRELMNAVEHGVALSSSAEVDTVHLPPRLLQSLDYLPPVQDRPATLAEVEKHYILKVLRETNGSQKKACKILDLSKTTLYRRLKEYDIQPKDSKEMDSSHQA